MGSVPIGSQQFARIISNQMRKENYNATGSSVLQNERLEKEEFKAGQPSGIFNMASAAFLLFTPKSQFGVLQAKTASDYKQPLYVEIEFPVDDLKDKNW